MTCEFCGHTNGGVVFIDRERRPHPICWSCQDLRTEAYLLATACHNRHPSDLPPRCGYRPFLHHRRAGRIESPSRV